MKPNIYAHGKEIRREDPILEKPINVLRLTFDLAQDPRYRDLLVTKSHPHEVSYKPLCLPKP
jgi:aromatic ring hydroxylase